jgi:hypothetical protein
MPEKTESAYRLFECVSSSVQLFFHAPLSSTTVLGSRLSYLGPTVTWQRVIPQRLVRSRNGGLVVRAVRQSTAGTRRHERGRNGIEMHP